MQPAQCVLIARRQRTLTMEILQRSGFGNGLAVIVIDVLYAQVSIHRWRYVDTFKSDVIIGAPAVAKHV